MGSRSVKAPPATPAVPVAAQAKQAKQPDADTELARERRRGVASTYNRFASTDSSASGKAKLGV